MGLWALAAFAGRLPHAGADSPPCPYQVSNQGPNPVATDGQTGLTWTTMVPGKQYALADAQAYCAGLGAGWRVPSLRELQTIVDEGMSSPAIDRATFTDGHTDVFWSSTPSVQVPTSAWGVSFILGETVVADQSTKQYVRCVSGS
jgi:hypothetical protein